MIEILSKLLELSFVFYLCLLFGGLCLETGLHSRSFFWKLLAGIALGINIYSAGVILDGQTTLVSPRDDVAIYGTIVLLMIAVYLIIRAICKCLK